MITIKNCTMFFKAFLKLRYQKSTPVRKLKLEPRHRNGNQVCDVRNTFLMSKRGVTLLCFVCYHERPLTISITCTLCI